MIDGNCKNCGHGMRKNRHQDGSQVHGHICDCDDAEYMKCENCKKGITSYDHACYSKETNVYLCTLDCLCDYAHEYLGCVPLPLEREGTK